MLQALLSAKFGAQLGRFIVHFNFRFVLDLYLARQVRGDFTHDLLSEDLV